MLLALCLPTVVHLGVMCFGHFIGIFAFNFCINCRRLIINRRNDLLTDFRLG